MAGSKGRRGVTLEDLGIKPLEKPKVTYIARTPLLGIKPIKCSDPDIFKQLVERLKEAYPDLKIYTFEIVHK